MNRIFKSKWNKKTGTYVAVSEIAKNSGKDSGSGKALRLSSIAGVVLTGVFAVSPLALAAVGTGGGEGQGTAISQCEGNEQASASTGSIAIGCSAKTTSNSSMAIGTGAIAKGVNTIALGKEAKITGGNPEYNIAIGSSAQSGGNRSVAIGGSAHAESSDGVALGSEARARGSSAVAIGKSTTASAISDIAIGSGAKTILSYEGVTDNPGLSQGQIAIGLGAKAEAAVKNDFSMAIGRWAQAKNKSTALGAYSEASAEKTLAIGQESKATRAGASAIGAGALAEVQNAIAIGNEAKVEWNGRLEDDSSMAIGTRAIAKGVNTIALGKEAKITGGNPEYNIAIGSSAQSGGNRSVAIGGSAHAESSDGVALGSEARARGNSAVAIGKSTTASAISDIAIGSGAKTILSYEGVTDNPGLSQGQIAIGLGAKAEAAVKNDFSMAIGRWAQAKNKSTALGAYSEASAEKTLAIGQESKATKENASALGFGATADLKNSVALGSDSEVSKAVQTKEFEIGNLRFGEFAGNAPEAGDVVSVGQEGTERQIQNVAAGRISEKSTDAVNGSQLFATNVVLSNLAGNVVKVIGGNATLGENGAITVTDIGGTAKNTIHEAIEHVNQGWTLTTNGGADAKDQFTVKPGNSVDFSNTDGNIQISQTITPDKGTKVELELSKELKGFEGIGLTGKDGKDGEIKTVIKIGEGAPGLDGIDGTDGITRIVYDDKEVATLDDGLRFVGDNKDVNVDRKLNQTLSVTGGVTDSDALTEDNIGVVGTAGDKGGLSIQLAKDLKDLNSITLKNGANTLVIDAEKGDITGLTNTDWKSDGTYNAGRAATEEQLGSLYQQVKTDIGDVSGNLDGLANNPITFAANSGSVQRKLGETISIVGGMPDTAGDGEASAENIRTVVKDDKLEIQLSKNLKGLNSVQVGDIKITTEGINAGNKKITNVAKGVNDTDAVNFGQLKDVQQNVENLGNRAVKYDGKAGDPKNIITLEGTNGTKITNLADGQIAATSKDAVNGSQIHNMGESIASGIGGASTFVNGKLITKLEVAGNSYTTVNDALNGVHSDLSTKIDNFKGIANAGWNLTDAEGNTANIGPNGTVSFVGDGNILVTQTGSNNDGKIKISVSQDLELNSLTATTINATTVNATTVNADSIAINNGGPVINDQGINMNNHRITNVAPGVEGTDAVNVNQLSSVNHNLQTQIDDNRNDIRRNNNRANAGVAAAMAIAGLPQAYLPGKSMVALSGGVWRGESGMAIGVSTVSENGKWILKGSANTSSRGGAGGTLGVGYQW